MENAALLRSTIRDRIGDYGGYQRAGAIDWIRQLVCGNSRTAKLGNQSSKRSVAREECRYTRDIQRKVSHKGYQISKCKSAKVKSRMKELWEPLFQCKPLESGFMLESFTRVVISKVLYSTKID